MSNPFRYFNSSPEIIRLAVLMYVKYPLSLRNVEDLLAERGIDISLPANPRGFRVDRNRRNSSRLARRVAAANRIPTVFTRSAPEFARAALQERRLRAEVSFNPRRRLQHLQRTTPSHLSPNPPCASRCGDDHVAERGRRGLTIPEVPGRRAGRDRRGMRADRLRPGTSPTPCSRAVATILMRAD